MKNQAQKQLKALTLFNELKQVK